MYFVVGRNHKLNAFLVSCGCVYHFARNIRLTTVKVREHLTTFISVWKRLVFCTILKLLCDFVLGKKH